MAALLGRLHAQLVVVSEEDAEVAAVIASPQERDVMVALRPIDVQVESLLTEFIWKSAMAISE